MGSIDKTTKVYMRRPEIFADAFNYYIYGGKQVIKPEMLNSLETEELVIPYSLGGAESSQKYRDLLDSAAIMEDGNTAYLLLGIENQSNVHYAMPVRNLLYDAIQYAKQVERLANKHKKEKNLQKRNEFLSGFSKSDKIIPVITLVLFFSSEPWDGPRSLHEMMDIPSPELAEFIPDYKLHLIEPANIGKSELDKFATTLREVMGYIKFSQSKSELTEWVETNPEFHCLERSAAMVIESCTNSQLNFNNDNEVIDVCKAISDIVHDSKTEGKIEGKIEGKLLQSKLIALRMHNAGLPLNQITEFVDFPQETVSSWLAEA